MSLEDAFSWYPRTVDVYYPDPPPDLSAEQAAEEAAILAGQMEAWRARRKLSVLRPRGIKRLIYKEEAAGLAAVDIIIWGILGSSAIFLLTSALKRR